MMDDAHGNLGKELARQILTLSALEDERKAAIQDFKARELAIRKEIQRLAIDVRTGQGSLFQPRS